MFVHNFTDETGETNRLVLGSLETLVLLVVVQEMDLGVTRYKQSTRCIYNSSSLSFYSKDTKTNHSLMTD